MRLAIPSLLAALLVTACSVGPDYSRPDAVVPDSYIGMAADEATVSNLPWWELFRDPTLIDLIDLSLANNRDLRIAIARIDEARARLGVVRGDQFPTVGVSGTFERGDAGEVTMPGSGITESSFIGVTAAYEVDLWGRYRRASEAERAALLAAEDNQRAVLIALVADVANAYLLLRDLDARLLIASETLELRKQSTAIIRERFDKGIVPLLDVNQAEIQEAEAAVTKASLARQQREAENLLNVLVGRNPAPILRDADPATMIVMPDVPVGLPSDLLERRPDVRSAESNLAAQTARIGVAQSLRFPSISLTGSFGKASQELSDLSDGTRIWGVGVDIFGPLFDGKKRRSQVEQEKARTEQALNSYEQSILVALREVEDSLAGVEGYREELMARERQIAAAASAAELSRARYDGGVTDYLEVLDSERSLFDAQLGVSAVRRLQLVAVVNLYKALGGGWEATRPSTACADTTGASPGCEQP